MRELELKGTVPDLDALVARLEELGARRHFVGMLQDRRMDDAGGSIDGRDEMLRVRVYRDGANVVSASLDWKGPSSIAAGGYKEREELSAPILDPESLLEVLGRAGLRTMLAVDRMIWQYELEGATIRLERYRRMDDLAEIEGDPAAIERTIVRLGLDRATFGADSLSAFVRRFEARTGETAQLSIGEDDE